MALGSSTSSGTFETDITGFDQKGYIKFAISTGYWTGQICNGVIDKIWVE